jgi:hypothetical protein
MSWVARASALLVDDDGQVHGRVDGAVEMERSRRIERSDRLAVISFELHLNHRGSGFF